jgi:hypothetical protein
LDRLRDPITPLVDINNQVIQGFPATIQALLNMNTHEVSEVLTRLGQVSSGNAGEE